MTIIANYEALLLEHKKLKRKLFTSYMNNLPKEIIESLKEKKNLVKERMIVLKGQNKLLNNNKPVNANSNNEQVA